MQKILRASPHPRVRTRRPALSMVMEDSNAESLAPYKLTPTTLDMRLPDVTLRERCFSALAGTLTPMFAITHHGMEGACASLAARATEFHGLPPAYSPNALPQTAYDLDGDLAPAAEELKGALLGLCARLVNVVAGEDVNQERGLQARLCMRTYAPCTDRPERLGAHCDATLLTLLWASAPGLQVLEPDIAREAGWTREQVLGFGVPSTTEETAEPPELHWATVDMPWSSGALLLTLGTGWTASEHPRLPTQSAVLHRVVIDPSTSTPSASYRLSLPLLVDWASPAVSPVP